MTTVWVTFRQEGWHHWPLAEGKRAYLAQSHRHMFHFRVELQVVDTDREVELHDLRDFCLREVNIGFGRLGDSGLDFGSQSCEELAELMCEILANEHPKRWVACEVSEDGECGARVEMVAR